MGSQLGSSGTFSAGTCPLRHASGVLRKTSVDVTSYITGDGAYNLAFSITLRLRREKLRLRSLWSLKRS